LYARSPVLRTRYCISGSSFLYCGGYEDEEGVEGEENDDEEGDDDADEEEEEEEEEEEAAEEKANVASGRRAEASLGNRDWPL